LAFGEFEGAHLGLDAVGTGNFVHLLGIKINYNNYCWGGVECHAVVEWKRVRNYDIPIRVIDGS
jgi:hypothetical protein